DPRPGYDATNGAPYADASARPVDTAPTNPELQGAPAESTTRPIGAACEKHCQCKTGYCYDEAYLGDFRFCTRDCDGGCEDGTSSIDSYRCLLLGGTLASKHDLTHTSICQKICETVEDCKALASAYDQCGDSKDNSTQWEGQTIAGQKTCQISAEVQ
ncbi:MAG: hypothetical protein VX938_01840, partial [Myxococcota bacterium]|nr:hypothetical protein [Myxococcota bacterium]